MTLNIESIPAELRDAPVWVVWKYQQRNGDKPTKVPYCVDGTLAKADDPETWSSLGAAMDALATGQYDGLGTEFDDGAGLTGVDLDDCLEEGHLKPWARTVLDGFAGTYAEVSPSGNGIKIWAKGRLPIHGDRTGGRKFVDNKGRPVRTKSESDGAIEMYHSRRYFAFTGSMWSEAKPLIIDKQRQIEDLFQHLFSPVATIAPQISSPLASIGPMPPIERCRKYIETTPNAISGENGHGRCFHVACICFRFGLNESEAGSIMHWYSHAKSDPPWSDKEIEHKIRDASKRVSENGEFGIMLTQQNAAPSKQKAVPADEVQEAPTFHFHTAAEFDALDLRRDYYIPDVLAAGPVPTIVAGSFKSLKTSVAMDLFISLATGTPFLGHFRIAKDARVGVMSGESGGFALQDLARRVCRSKGRDMVSIGDWFNICTTVPTLSDQQHMETIERIIEERKLDIVAIDPTYLAMRGMRTEDAGNLFSMGKFLEPLSRMAERTGCTPVIIHHNSRGATRANVNEPAELADIAWSGFAEWAGQWVLLSRRERYDPDSNGEHRLWLNAGGRDGHSTLVGVDVTEGKQTDKGGRRWDVAVEGARDARKQLAELQEERKSYQKEAAIERDRELIIKVMGKVPDGDTKTGIKDRCGMNSGRFDKAFAALMQEDLILSCEIKKGNGAMYPGFSLNTIKASAPKKKEPGLIA